MHKSPRPCFTFGVRCNRCCPGTPAQLTVIRVAAIVPLTSVPVKTPLMSYVLKQSCPCRTCNRGPRCPSSSMMKVPVRGRWLRGRKTGPCPKSRLFARSAKFRLDDSITTALAPRKIMLGYVPSATHLMATNLREVPVPSGDSSLARVWETICLNSRFYGCVPKTFLDSSMSALSG